MLTEKSVLQYGDYEVLVTKKLRRMFERTREKMRDERIKKGMHPLEAERRQFDAEVQTEMAMACRAVPDTNAAYEQVAARASDLCELLHFLMTLNDVPARMIHRDIKLFNSYTTQVSKKLNCERYRAAKAAEHRRRVRDEVEAFKASLPGSRLEFLPADPKNAGLRVPAAV